MKSPGEAVMEEKALRMHNRAGCFGTSSRIGKYEFASGSSRYQKGRMMSDAAKAMPTSSTPTSKSGGMRRGDGPRRVCLDRQRERKGREGMCTASQGGWRNLRTEAAVPEHRERSQMKGRRGLKGSGSVRVPEEIELWRAVSAWKKGVGAY
ncbi:hypothetical protein C8R44DRAFT_724468 [Mycena epipterygia]|nr:hypothetical protein C8R44DRAFT_724468 [Mycena epipterygia]